MNTILIIAAAILAHWKEILGFTFAVSLILYVIGLLCFRVTEVRECDDHCEHHSRRNG